MSNQTIQVRVLLRCRDHRHWPTHSLKDTNITTTLEAYTEQAARRLLSRHITALKERFACTNVQGAVELVEDLPSVRVRRATTLIRSADDRFTPKSYRCAHCGWLANGGTVDAARNFYCKDEECIAVRRG